MANTNSLYGTWKLNSTIDINLSVCYVDFTCVKINGVKEQYKAIGNYPGNTWFCYFVSTNIYQGWYEPYQSNAWVDESARTISISTETDDGLLTWLNSNAVKLSDELDYVGSEEEPEEDEEVTEIELEFKTLMNELSDVINEKAKTSGKKNLSEMVETARDIKVGVEILDANATPNDVLLGKVAYNNDGKFEGAISTYKGAVSGVQALVGNTLKRLLDYTKSCAHMFQNNTTITYIDEYFEYDDTMNVTNVTYMFSGCTKLQKFPRINMENVTNGSYLFKGCTSLSNIEDLDISNATDVSYLFDGCTNLIVVDVNVQNATHVSYLFNNCTNLKQVNIVITNATNTLNMFYNCTKLENISQLDTSKVTNMSYMFYGNYNLEKIDISYYNISSTSNSNYTFYNCYSLKELIIRGFGYISLNSNAFQNCYHLTGTVNATYNPNGDKDGYIYVPRNSVNTIKSTANWSVYSNQIVPIFDALPFGDGNVEEIINDNNETILTATANENSRFVGWYKCLLITSEKVVNTVESIYETLEITYPFTLNDSGYYQNSNQKVSNSYSIGRFNFNIENENQILRIRYLQSSENGYDYGVVGTVDTALAQSTANTGYTTFKGVTTTTEKEVFISNISVGEHFIDIKYIKDGSGDTGTDTLQVKVEVVTIEIVVEMINEELYSIENTINLGVIDEQTMQPFNLAGVFEGVEA